MERLISGAAQAHALGITVNAGHGINYQNMTEIYKIPHLHELNIGHSIISRSVSVGLAQAVAEMKALCTQYPQ